MELASEDSPISSSQFWSQADTGEEAQEAVSGWRVSRERQPWMREEVTHGNPGAALERKQGLAVCLLPEEHLPARFICSTETTT